MSRLVQRGVYNERARLRLESFMMPMLTQAFLRAFHRQIVTHTPFLARARTEGQTQEVVNSTDMDNQSQSQHRGLCKSTPGMEAMTTRDDDGVS